MKNLAVENFKNGYSCSESIAKAAFDKGIIDMDLTSVATSFSGGMSSGCLCGAIAGAQMVIGYLYGKKADDKGLKAREFAKEFINKFKEQHKATCCKVLTRDYEFSSPERKKHCTEMVSTSAEILEQLIKN